MEAKRRRSKLTSGPLLCFFCLGGRQGYVQGAWRTRGEEDQDEGGRVLCPLRQRHPRQDPPVKHQRQGSGACVWLACPERFSTAQGRLRPVLILVLGDEVVAAAARALYG